MLAQPLPSTEATFEQLEAAVRQTVRGQSFLEEFARRVRAAETDKVLTAVEHLAQVHTQLSPESHIEVLRRELETMSASISQTRKEIASIKPEGSGQNKIVAATEELDEVVRSTERSAADILSAAERIQSIGLELKSKGAEAKLCDELEEQSTNLMLACSFQDLTGQRMNKVVNTLRYLEQRVNAMIEVWGITAADLENGPARQQDGRPDAHLLNGPAKTGEGVAQDDIDRMLSGAPLDESENLTVMPDGPASQADIDQLFE